MYKKILFTMRDNLNDKNNWIYDLDYTIRQIIFTALVSIIGVIITKTFSTVLLKSLSYCLIIIISSYLLLNRYIKAQITLYSVEKYYKNICKKYMDKNKFFTNYSFCKRNFRTQLETSMDLEEKIVGVDSYIDNLYLKEKIRYVLTGVPGIGKKSFSLILSFFLIKKAFFFKRWKYLLKRIIFLLKNAFSFRRWKYLLKRIIFLLKNAFSFRRWKYKQEKIIFPLWFSMSIEEDIKLLIECLENYNQSPIYTYIKGRKLLKNRIIIRKRWFPLFVISSWDQIPTDYISEINIGLDVSFVILSNLNNEPVLSGSEIFNQASRFSFLPLNDQTAQSFLIKLYDEIDREIAEYIVNQITTKLDSDFLIPFFLEKIIDTILESGKKITKKHFDAYLETVCNTRYGLLNEYFMTLIIKALQLDESYTELSQQKNRASELIPRFAEITYKLVNRLSIRLEFAYSEIRNIFNSIFGNAEHDNDRELKIYINTFFISQYLTVPIIDESSHLEISHSLLRDYLLATAISEKWKQNNTSAEEEQIFLTWMSDPNFDEVWYLLSEKWKSIEGTSYAYEFIEKCFSSGDNINAQELEVLKSCFRIFQQTDHINDSFKKYWRDTYEHYYSIDSEPFQRLRLSSKGIKTIIFDFLKIDEKEKIIPKLSSCKYLETLNFFETDVSKVSFSGFKSENHIRSLNLISSKFKDIDLNSLNNLSNLEELSFSWNKNKLKLCTFSKCKKLKDLVITSGDIEIILTNENVFPELQYITLIGLQESDKAIDLSFLQNFKKLESIIICGYKIKSTELKFIGSKTLKSLWIINTGIENIYLDILEKLPYFKQLVLIGNPIKQIDLEPLEQCDQLEVIDLGNNRLTEIDLEPLEQCDQLEVIDLGNNRLTEIDVAPIIHLRNLKIFSYKSQQPVKLLCKRNLKKQISSPALKAIKKDYIKFY